MRKYSKVRRIFAVIASVLCAGAIIAELSTQICIPLFDPLPDVWCVIAYSFLPAMMLLNEYILGEADAIPPHPSIVRRLHAASVGTALGIMIALVYSILFIPAFPYSIFALLFFGMGIGAWSPFLSLVVLLVQCQALHDHLRFHHASDYSWRIAAICTGVALLIVVTVPLLPVYIRHAAFLHMPGHAMFSSWWKFVHGENPLASD